MPKCYVIDAAAHCLRDATYANVRDLQVLVGGYISGAWRSPHGDVLYVDDEGMLKPAVHFFLFAGRPDQPLAGNGVLVGAERLDARGDLLGTDDPVMTLARLTTLVRFVDRAYVDAWGKANASEPAIALTTAGPHGPERVVLHTYGSVVGNIPRPPE
jgi:hypothetical protein